MPDLEGRVVAASRWAVERMMVASSAGIWEEPWIWEFLADADRGLCEALDRWSATGSERDRRKVIEAADALVERVKEAGRERWRRACHAVNPPAPLRDPLQLAMTVGRGSPPVVDQVGRGAETPPLRLGL